jgi:tripartite-type tricarboxylate transporter receptor subunit TctC
MKRRQWLSGAAAFGIAGVAAPRVWAQAGGWPNKPVTILNPFPAGGGTDAFARPLSAYLTKTLGQNFIIDNRGGAGGTVGAAIAAKAPPDGYTLFMGAVHHTIAPSMYPKLDYDIEKDFVPIMLVARVPQVVVVNPQRVQAKTMAEFLAFVRSNPGKLNYASAGNGTSHHLAGELFKGITKTFITHIPYRGAGPALQDLLAGSVDLMFDGLGSSAQHIRGGRLRPLAVAAQKRVPAFPDLPTAIEAGVPNYVVSTWYGVWAVKGTPADVQAKVLQELTKAVQAPEIKQVWDSQGAEAVVQPPSAFAEFIGAEIKRWAAVVKSSGAKLD